MGSAHAHARSPDLLECNVNAAEPNKRWLCDIAYIPTDRVFLCLAGAIDAWTEAIWVEHVEHAECDDCGRRARGDREDGTRP
jgi:hypothetical protein